MTREARAALRETGLLIAAFLSAIGLAGVLKLDDWLALWALEPVQAFRRLSQALFFWVPRDWVSPETAALHFIYYSVILRGYFVEREGPRGLLQILKEDKIFLFMLPGLIFFPVLMVQLIEFIVCYASSQCKFSSFYLGSNFGSAYMLLVYLWVVVIVVAMAPRTFLYILGFVLLFYGWGIVAGSDLPNRLPVPS